MSENTSMEELMEQMEGLNDIHMGDVVDGTVISVNEDEAILDIHYMSDAILPKEEIEMSTTEGIEIGAKFPVYILKINDGEGNVLVSLKRAENIVVWDEFEKAVANKTPINVKIKESVKGGLVAQYKGARIFIPASHVSADYIEDLGPFINTFLEIEIIEFDQSKQRVVGSRKVIEKVLNQKVKADKLSRLSPNDLLTGKVVRLENYGAFVDLGGIDGLIHISRMSWKRIKHPSEVLTVGDLVDVIVQDVDREKEKISLRLAQIQENPWDVIEETYQKGDIVSGTVVKLMNFGVFVALESGVEGLVHISELADHHVANPSEVVKEDQTVDVMILEINAKEKRISLSIKAVNDDSLTNEFEEFLEEESGSTTLSDLFGDKLKNLKF